MTFKCRRKPQELRRKLVVEIIRIMEKSDLKKFLRTVKTEIIFVLQTHHQAIFDFYEFYFCSISLFYYLFHVLYVLRNFVPQY